MEEDIQNHSRTVMFRGTPCMILLLYDMFLKINRSVSATRKDDFL